MNLFTNSASFLSQEIETALTSIMIAIPNWKWLVLIITFLAAYTSRGLLLHILKSIKASQRKWAEKNTFLKHFFDLEIEKGFSWIILSLVLMVFVENMDLTLNIEKYLLIICKLFFSYNTIRVIYLSAEAFGFVMKAWSEKTASQIDDQLAPLATKTLKVLVLIIGTLILLQNFGVNVTALLAGLGIGGVALAFAAQDTVANVFGTITILLDSPFKLGDRIKIMDVDGHILEVGFRSTRIRTLYNSIVTLPNSVVAKEKIDNLTERNNVFRFRTILGFTYSSTQEQLQNFIENLKYFLKQENTVDQDRVTVHFLEFADSSLNILVNFHFTLNDPALETEAQEKFLFYIYKLSAENKLSFAYPTRTVLIENSLPRP